MPEAGPERIGGRQRPELSDHQIDAGLFQSFQMLSPDTAIQGVEGVGNQHNGHARIGCTGSQQRLGQFGGQIAQAVFSSEIIEQKHVDNDQLPGLAYQRQHGISYLLLVLLLTLTVHKTVVNQQ